MATEHVAVGDCVARRQGVGMGIFSGLVKAGLAKKVIDEARKPENLRKIKEVVAKARNRRSPGTPQ